MAETANVSFGKKLGTTIVGALAVTGVLLGVGAGTASADKLTPDPSKPSAGPTVKDGVRKSGYAESEAVQGDVRESRVAVPNVTAKSPQPGNLSELGLGW